jgi:glycosyltransferase-like protein
MKRNWSSSCSKLKNLGLNPDSSVRIEMLGLSYFGPKAILGNNMLKIALFVYSTKPRGGVIHTLALANALHSLGHTVCVYALDKDGQGFDYPLQCASQLVSAQPAPSSTDALIAQRIQEFVTHLQQETQPYDIYHAQDCISANALLQLRDRNLIPHFIRTVHHIEDFQSLYLQQCQERSIQFSDLCLCLSQYWQSELQQHYHREAPLVHNGINTARFMDSKGSTAELKQQLEVGEGPVFLTVGGIEPRKNSIGLLQAFAKVRSQLPTAQLIIAGGATLFDYQPYRDSFFELAQELGIATGESLLLPGILSHETIPLLYRLADSFVFPSLKEGWGLVILEAIASNLPVITSNQPPFTEFLTPEQVLLVNPYDVDALAQAMIASLQQEVADRLKQKSQSVLAQYSWEASARIHVQCYRQLLQLRSASDVSVG